MQDGVSPSARRLLSLAAAGCSFQGAADALAEFCGLKVCDNTVRSVALAAGRAVREWRRTSPAPAEAFAKAEGDVELAVDGTSVNTLGGWRELRLAVFAKRPAGRPALPAEWDSRHLPAPTARFAFGGLWTSDRFGPMWRASAGRLGVRDAAGVTVLGDGAKWIWKEADGQLPGSQGVLDVYHACEHLFACGDRLFGEGSAEGRAWAEARRKTLLEKGSEGVRAELAAELKTARSPRRRKALAELSAYLEPHAGRTRYAARLAAGRSIGSGLVEGACKTVVGRRLKQTGARWRVRHAEEMTALCCLRYSGLWDAYWSAAG